MPHLFDPLKIKDITLRNRVGVAPMCQYCYEKGFSNDWQLVHLGAMANGGAGLIIVEATAVEARGRISPNDLGIWSDAHIEPLARVVRYLKSQGTVAGIQIAHAGRKACTVRPWDGHNPIQPDDPRFWPIVGPSPLPFDEGYQVPHELTIAEIHEIQQAFVYAAERSLKAGFEWMEVHCAHGYLLNSFLSPLTNKRTDRYGGSFENRTRMVIETVQQVRKVWPERLPLTVRISGTEWVEGGWNVEDSVDLARKLRFEGIDLVDCSSAGNIPHILLPSTPGYQVPIAEAVRRDGGVLSAAVGLITEPAQAEEIIASGKADLVLLARAILRDPAWPIHAALALGQEAPIPSQYLRSYRIVKGKI